MTVRARAYVCTSCATKQFRPDWAVHPGKTLAEALTEKAISQSELARQMGFSRAHLNQVINGHQGIGVGLALGLERTIGADAAFWLQLQVNFDLTRARQAT